MKRTDAISLLFLYVAVLLIYYPVFYSTYLYTDEANFLWLSSKGVSLTFVQQGRYITHRLVNHFFNAVSTAQGVTRIRLFSLLGWLICLPLWYYIIKDIIVKNRLPFVLLLLSMVFLIAMPPFAISIGWAACLELFIANTCGLLSGYALYRALTGSNTRKMIRVVLVLTAVLFGLLSLFTYQNGFGCFFIPFFLLFISTKKITPPLYAGLGFSLLIFGIYYLMFQYSLTALGTTASSRGTLASNPFEKLAFFVARPLQTAFHLTWLFNERRMTGKIVYIVVAVIWLLLFFSRQKRKPVNDTIMYLGGIAAFFLLLYLPSLIVHENYASNRTLFALDFVVFLMLAETVLSLSNSNERQNTGAVIVMLLLLLNAGYNFHRVFLMPVMAEYNLVKNAVDSGFTDNTTAVYFIQPPEDAFEIKYGIAASWDEFGVPSTAKSWVPDPLIKQIIFEKTGSRERAEKVVVKCWAGTAAFVHAGMPVTSQVLIIDAGRLITAL